MKMLLLLIALVVTASDFALGQQPSSPVPRRALPMQPGMPDRIQDPSPTDLSRNYQLTFTFKSGDKIEKQVTILTASPQVRANASIEIDEETRMTAEVNGELTEKGEGGLRFSYHLGASIPFKYPSAQAIPGNPQVIAPRGTNYAPESVTGVLIAEPGKTYEVFKSGSRSYSVSISPEEPAKVK